MVTRWLTGPGSLNREQSFPEQFPGLLITAKPLIFSMNISNTGLPSCKCA